MPQRLTRRCQRPPRCWGSDMDDCLFCKIVKGEIPSARVYEDDFCIAVNDIEPQAPVHLLLIPKKHFDDITKLDDVETAGRLTLAVGNIARKLGIEGGFRTVINTGKDAGQSVQHLHFHLLAGREFTWPAG